jgi:hypothetical protein
LERRIRRWAGGQSWPRCHSAGWKEDCRWSSIRDCADFRISPASRATDSHTSVPPFCASCSESFRYSE